MARSVTLNGTSYSIPQTGDSGWSLTGGVDDYLVALAAGVLQKAGGAFTLTAEVDFGASFGLKSLYVKSETANPAAAGQLRLAKTDTVSWRNNANGADLPLGINVSDALTFNSIVLADISSAQTLTNKSMSGSSNTFTNLPATGLTGLVAPANGGTGVANNAASTQTITGSYALGWTLTGATSLTLPTAGTLATLAGAESLSNKTFVAPVLGTPASGTATNLTGLPLTTGVTGTLPVLNGGTGVTTATGTGNVVLSTSPTLVTPVLGTPTSGLLTNATGLPLTSGVTGVLPVLNGGTGSSTVVSAPAATAWAGWDANSNLSANNHIEGYATTATAAGITTLLVGSAYQQFFTGSTTQTVKLPVTSTLVLGQQFQVINNSSGVVTVQSSGANTVQAMAASSTAVYTCILTSGTTAASWAVNYGLQNAGAGTVTSVAMTVPAFLSIAGSPITNSGTLALTLSGTGLPGANVALADSSSNAGVVNPYGGTGVVYSARYTPTLTAISNCIQGGLTSASCHYSRNGKIVTCSGNVTIESGVTSGGTVRLSISLPVASTPTAYADVAGVCAWQPAAGVYVAGFIGWNSGSNADVYLGNGTNTSVTGNFNFTFQYEIK